MSHFRVSLNVPRWATAPPPADSFARSVGPGLTQAVEATMEAVQAETRSQRVAQGYRVDPVADDHTVAVGVFNDSPLWGLVEKPTKPHAIRAKNKPRLAFRYNGHLVRPLEVNHPGTTGTGTFRRTWDARTPVMVAAIERRIRAWWATGGQG